MNEKNDDKKYNVNFDNYLKRYFHNEEEIRNNFSIGKIFFKNGDSVKESQ